MNNKASIYLDYAAATPVDPAVQKVMQPYLANKFYNPSALYLAAKDVKFVITDARKSVARILGSQPTEIIFTAGGSEANNLAIHGVMQKHPTANLVISALEHDSIRNTAGQYRAKEARVSRQGIVEVAKLAKLIDDKTVLVSIMLANNEIGSIQPIKEISQLVRQIRKKRQQNGIDMPLYLHTDACQAANYLDIHVARLGVDMMTLNGGKIYGPKQSGILYLKSGVELQPQILGGGQERGMRSGTENVAGIIGFAKALEIANQKRKGEATRLAKLQAVFATQLQKQLTDSYTNGPAKRRLPNNVSLTIPGQDNERLVMLLDERGIMCATGSACSASKEESSHVLRAIGMDDETARATLRFSMGRGTTKNDVTLTVKTLAQIVS